MLLNPPQCPEQPTPENDLAPNVLEGEGPCVNYLGEKNDFDLLAQITHQNKSPMVSWCRPEWPPLPESLRPSH